MKNLVVLAILALLIFGCTLSEHQSEKTNNSIKEPVKKVEEKKDDKLEQISDQEVQKEEPKSPRRNVSIYKGFWLPSLDQASVHSMENREDIVGLGSNTIAFGLGIPYEKDGKIKEELIPELKKKTKELIKYYREVGLIVVLAPEPIPSNVYGEPGPIPENIREQFLKDYNTVIIELAKIAEEENAEVFSPMNEPDYKLGTEMSSSWGQQILPEIKKVFKGKVLWKGALSDKLTDQKNIDFKGYDIIGFTIFPFGDFDNYDQEVLDVINKIGIWAKEDVIKEIWISEFGNYKYTGIPKEKEPRSLEIVFEEGKGKVNGFFVFDPPKGFGTQIKGSYLETVIKEQFEKLNEDIEAVNKN